VTGHSIKSAIGTRWSREQIRAARLAPLLPLLQKPQIQLLEHGGGNYLLPAFPDLIIKDGYWRWPQRNLAGNATCSRRRSELTSTPRSSGCPSTKP
jgi:hypothetical protein